MYLLWHCFLCSSWPVTRNRQCHVGHKLSRTLTSTHSCRTTTSNVSPSKSDTSCAAGLRISSGKCQNHSCGGPPDERLTSLMIETPPIFGILEKDEGLLSCRCHPSLIFWETLKTYVLETSCRFYIFEKPSNNIHVMETSSIVFYMWWLLPHLQWSGC